MLDEQELPARCRRACSCPEPTSSGSTTSSRRRALAGRGEHRRGRRRDRGTELSSTHGARATSPLTADTLNTVGSATPTEIEVAVLNGGTVEETDVVVSYELLGGTEPIEGEGTIAAHRGRRHDERRRSALDGEIPSRGRADPDRHGFPGARRVDRRQQRGHLPGHLRVSSVASPLSASPSSGPPGPSRRTRCAPRPRAAAEYRGAAGRRRSTTRSSPSPRGEADRALVPFENSIEGSVRPTLDALAFDADGVTIAGEHDHPIRTR